MIVDIDPLEVVIDPEGAMASTTLLYDSAPGNVVFDTTALGLPDLSGDEFFADCEVTATGRFVNQRVAPCPMEVRGSAVAWIDGRLHQWVSTQHAHGIKESFVAGNGVASEDVRVITPDVGGGFGAKITTYPEEIVLGGIAKRVGRPVRWQETRSESMMALGHGRAQVQHVTIGGRRDGTVTHYRLHVIQDSGAFCDMGAILAPFMTRPMSSGVYDIPNIECRTTSVVTNTTPTTAYRGAGRPEATAAIERAMDLFAAEVGMDPAEVRRTNLIAPFQRAAHDADRPDLRRRRLRRRPRPGPRTPPATTTCGPSRRSAGEAGDPVQLGIGVSTYVEITGGVPPMGEAAKIEVLDDGRAIVYTGTSPHGQGHDTTWSMIAQRPDRHPDGPHRAGVGRHRPRARRRRHDGLAFAAAGRRGRRQGRRRAGRAGQ